jgi:hypothetical protein
VGDLRVHGLKQREEEVEVILVECQLEPWHLLLSLPYLMHLFLHPIL